MKQGQDSSEFHKHLTSTRSAIEQQGGSGYAHCIKCLMWSCSSNNCQIIKLQQMKQLSLLYQSFIAWPWDATMVNSGAHSIFIINSFDTTHQKYYRKNSNKQAKLWKMSNTFHFLPLKLLKPFQHTHFFYHHFKFDFSKLKTLKISDRQRNKFQHPSLLIHLNLLYRYPQAKILRILQS